MPRTRYEQIGDGYALTRREDPAYARLIALALGEARTVVNVGAGSGSYEPRDRYVIAIEPSDVMSAQRPQQLPPAIRGTAGDLPLRDKSVDAAMAILTIHHWDEEQERGVRELRRVCRGPVLIMTYDHRVSGEMWLMKDYLPEVAELDRRIFPSCQRIGDWLGGATEVQVLEVSRTTQDWMLGSFWPIPNGSSTRKRGPPLLDLPGCSPKSSIASSAQCKPTFKAVPGISDMGTSETSKRSTSACA